MNPPNTQRIQTGIAVGLFLLLAYWLVSAALSSNSLEGETAMLSNVVIEFVRNGKLVYPMHAQKYLFSGIETFIIHPPLNYLLAAGMVSLFGISILPMYATTILVSVTGIASLLLTARRWGNPLTMIYIPLLALTCALYHRVSLTLRPDLLLGFFLLLVVLLMHRAWTHRFPPRTQHLYSFSLGVLCVAGFATHWNGAMLFPFAVAHLIMLSRMGYRSSEIAVSAGFGLLGIILAFIPWVLFYGKDFVPAITTIFFAGTTRVLLDHWTYPFSTFVYNTLFTYNGVWIVLGIAAALSGFVLYRLRNTLPERYAFLALAPTTMDAMMTAGLLYFFTFFLLVVWHRQPVYMGNGLFLALYLAGRGAAHCTAILAYLFNPALFSQRTYRTACAFGLAAALLVTSGASRFNVNGYKFRLPWKLDTYKEYRETAQLMSHFVPHNIPVVLGALSYQYLYNTQYTGLYELFARQAFDLSSIEASQSVLEREKKIFRGRQDYSPRKLSVAARRESLTQAPDVLVLTANSNYGFQSIYAPKETWDGIYRRVALVFPHNGRIQHIFYKPQALTHLPKTAPPPHTFRREGTSWVLTFDPTQAPATMNLRNWRKLTLEAQSQYLHNYLAKNHWFGLPNPTSLRTNTLVERMLYHINLLTPVYNMWDFDYLIGATLKQSRQFWDNPRFAEGPATPGS
ncbi:MAG: ArnT family glycosyltransferase [Candidatus Melainabacteria bacterium]